MGIRRITKGKHVGRKKHIVAWWKILQGRRSLKARMKAIAGRTAG
jgi:hypothetical protein